jgi:riboflavin kinase/FMN adenylyltransferase
MYDGACNIGPNPTFDDEAISIEVFIFDFAGDLYGQSLRLFFVERVRDEKKFPDVAALQQAIEEDVARAMAVLKDTVVLEYHEPSIKECNVSKLPR